MLGRNFLRCEGEETLGGRGEGDTGRNEEEGIM